MAVDWSKNNDREIPEGFKADSLGIIVNKQFEEIYHNYPTGALPLFDEEYFEWIDLLEAVKGAKDTFTMFEIGAGFGRWSARGAALANRNGLKYDLTAVEPEPVHYQWLLQHSRTNKIDFRKEQLINAVLSTRNGSCWLALALNDPKKWYGQAMFTDWQHYHLGHAFGIFPRKLPCEFIKVKQIRAKEIFVEKPSIDLIDIDVQGQELTILRAVKRELCEKTRRVHIGTHTNKIEANLRSLFTKLGWRKIFDFPTNSTVETEYGIISFADGVQSWINPNC